MSIHSARPSAPRESLNISRTSLDLAKVELADSYQVIPSNGPGIPSNGMPRSRALGLFCAKPLWWTINKQNVASNSGFLKTSMIGSFVSNLYRVLSNSATRRCRTSETRYVECQLESLIMSRLTQEENDDDDSGSSLSSISSIYSRRLPGIRGAGGRQA